MKLLLFILLLTEFVNPIVDDITDEIVEEIVSDVPQQDDVSGDDVGTIYIIEDGHAVPVPDQIIVNDNSDLAVRLDSLIDLQKENTEALNDRISSLESNVSSILGASFLADDIPDGFHLFESYTVLDSYRLKNNPSLGGYIFSPYSNGRGFYFTFNPSFDYILNFSGSSAFDYAFLNYSDDITSSVIPSSFYFEPEQSFTFTLSSDYLSTLPYNTIFVFSVSPTFKLKSIYTNETSSPVGPDNPDDPDNPVDPDDPYNPDNPDNPDDPIIPDEPDSTILDGINKTNAYLKALEKSNRDLKRLLEIVGFTSIVSSMFPILRSAIHKLMFREDN